MKDRILTGSCGSTTWGRSQRQAIASDQALRAAQHGPEEGKSGSRGFQDLHEFRILARLTAPPTASRSTARSDAVVLKVLLKRRPHEEAILHAEAFVSMASRSADSVNRPLRRRGLGGASPPSGAFAVPRGGIDTCGRCTANC